MGNNRVPTIHPSDTARVRQSDPIESHMAADATQSSVAASQQAVFAILKDALLPLTDNDLAQYLTGRFSPSRVRTARKDFARRDPVTTNPTKAVHAVRGQGDPRPYCGTRKGRVTTPDLALITCSNCTSAIRADHTDGGEK